ncbi:uncharacterized protein LOC132256724 [Phlebotomus argentipes]|uniref:uncharacterized protein LOC132256724 n=1 Tax=Phlebotomus argentipes TaxID=94469 RepID=UPI002892B5A9|nr:uncharacterized protein LOC132256724 [Phlebotomus argentipes]
MRILAGLSIITRCTLARRFPQTLGSFTYQRFEFLHTSKTLGIFQHIQRKKWNEEKIRNMDKLPSHWTLIYRNPMYNYVSAMTWITTVSFTVIGIFLAHWLITGHYFLGTNEQIEAQELGPGTSNLSEVVVMCGFFIIFNGILRVTLNRFPLRIYQNGEKYLAIYTWKVPYRNEILEYSKGDVVQVPPRGMLWASLRYKIRGRKTILLYNYFRSPSDLHGMMHPDAERY